MIFSTCFDKKVEVQRPKESSQLVGLINNVPRVVVVAQLVEWSLPIPEVRRSNPVIGKKYFEHLLSTVLKRRK